MKMKVEKLRVTKSDNPFHSFKGISSAICMMRLGTCR
jgi:hypothetical protein